MVARKSFPWWVIVLIVGCLCILCLCVAGAAALIPSFVSERVPQSDLPFISTYLPMSTIEALLPGLTTSGGATAAPASGQLVNDHYFFDDFSSDALDWFVYDDGKSIFHYENGQYSLQVTEPDYYDWIYAPIDFQASEIVFNLQGLPGPQNGTFGVFCQYQDIDNYYYVEFDLELREYLVGTIVNGVETLHTDADDNNYGWDSTEALKSLPEQVNSIAISCTLDYLSLTINGQYIQDFLVSETLDTPGDVAFFVFAYDFADTSGYKVFIDNVEIYNPMP